MLYVYILTNWNNNLLYVGVTNNLKRRITEHNSKIYKGHTAKYGINKLVYYEKYSDPSRAIEREKHLKSGNREKKLYLINNFNPEWLDLSNQL